MKGTKPLPGMEDPVNEDVREKTLKYVDVRDRRMQLTKEEVEANQDLLDVMHEAHLKRYRDPETGFLAEITKETKEKVRVVMNPDKGEDVKDAIDGVTPGEDEPIAKRTMKKGKPNAGVPREAE